MSPVQTNSTLLEPQSALDKTVARCEGCFSADLSGAVAILHPVSGLYFGLNEVGGSIWNFLSSPRKVSQILEHLLEEYDVQKEVCRKHLLQLLAALEENQLVTLSD